MRHRSCSKRNGIETKELMIMAKGIMKSRHVWQQVQAMAESFRASTNCHTDPKNPLNTVSKNDMNSYSNFTPDHSQVSHAQDPHSRSTNQLMSSPDRTSVQVKSHTSYGNQDLHNELMAFKKAFEQI